MPSKGVSVPVTLIRDGEVLWEEIIDMGFNESLLKSQLNTQNIIDYKDVFIAEWLQGDGLFLQLFKN
ncbi:YetF domain-containing protein [Peribacillus simplex]|uniref:YetF domain-containing protein n=1 Tax=Peribacillus simplex TaxID=1478 RepID=UPI0035D41391